MPAGVAGARQSAMQANTEKIERVQDTARWVAMARAKESERNDALFKDPFARKLAGTDGVELLKRLSGRAGGSWPIVARTHIIDGLVSAAIHDGADAVLNLAAGLDSRPYRMDLPSSLTWIEADHADMIADKEARLAGDKPVCRLERIAQDLANGEERRALLAKIGGRFRRVLVMTEGLLCYLATENAMGLAKDLRAMPGVFRWIADLNNAAVNEYVAKRTKHALQGTAKMQFGPEEGPLVFQPLGWKTVSATSIFKTAGQLKRLPFPLWIFARLPDKPYGTPGRPWSAVCVWEPKGSSQPETSLAHIIRARSHLRSSDEPEECWHHRIVVHSHAHNRLVVSKAGKLHECGGTPHLGHAAAHHVKPIEAHLFVARAVDEK